MKESKGNMSCKEIQKMIISFIQNELSNTELECFIDHVNNCPDCKEEYDVYYTLLTGMKLLEEDKVNGKSRAPDSNENLFKIEEKLIKEKMKYIRRRILLASIILFLTFSLFH